MAELLFAGVVVACLGFFLALLGEGASRPRGKGYLLAAWGFLALAGICQLTSLAVGPGLYALGEGWKGAGLVLWGAYFLGSGGSRLAKRSWVLLAGLVLVSLLVAFLPVLLGWENYLLAIKLYQFVLALTFVAFLAKENLPAKRMLITTLSLWLVMVLGKSGSFPAAMQLLVSLGFSLVVFRVFLLNLRQLNKQKKNLVKEKEVTLSFLEKIGATLSDAFDLDQVLKMVMDCVMASAQAKAGAIFLMSDDKKELTVDVVKGLFPPLHKTTDKTVTRAKYIREKFMADRIKVGEGVIGEVAATGRSIIIRDAQRDPRTPKASTDFLLIETMVVSPIKTKDEVVGVIALVNKENGEQFSETDDSLLHALGNQASISINNAKLYRDLSGKERLEQELRIARDIQEFLFPKEAPHLEGFELASLARPATEVGGDYYDYIQVSKNEWGLVIADVSGKGAPGALVMAMVRSMLRAEAVGKSSPVEVLSRINRSIYRDIKENMFVSLFYMVLNVKEKTLHYARAGHDPCILFHGARGEHEFLDKGGIALGLDESSFFEEALELGKVDLVPGDTLVLYTDGITEAVNKENEEFGLERLLEIIRRNAREKKGKGGADALVKEVNREIIEFTGGLSQRDDITLMTLKVR